MVLRRATLLNSLVALSLSSPQHFESDITATETKGKHVGNWDARERKKLLVLMNIWNAIANEKVPQILLQRIAYIPVENTFIFVT